MSVFLSFQLSSQSITVFAEDFNGNGHDFSLNTGSVGDNSGPNKWIVNKEYIGTPLYPNTLRQDSVVLGTINGAPFSNYLHIHDENARQNNDIANANFDPDVASDRFAEVTEPICTKSMYNVTVTFYYLVQGNEDAYGEVYFNKDNEGWKKTGPDKLYHAEKWQLLSITDSSMDNAEDLRIGIRWVNHENSGPTSTSLSIDEFIVVADFDLVNNPLEITSELNQDTVCWGSSISVEFSLSDTFCAGTYRFWLSEPGGSFQNPQSLGIINWEPFFPTTFNINVGLPQFSTDTNVCYKIRVTRTDPQPVVVGEISEDCFYQVVCPPTIITHQPPVTIGSLDSICDDDYKPCECDDGYTLCAGSVIDIPFNSIGTLYESNNYVGILSTEIDTITFGDDTVAVLVNGDTINSIPDPNDYPAIPPGMVGGKVPFAVEPGCNYYVQINSTAPEAYGTIWGPFCIDKCDLTTGQDVQHITEFHACATDTVVTDTGSVKVTIPMEINRWTDSVDYFVGNEFQVQVLDFNSLQVINTGGLGVVADTAADSLVITIPGLPTLLAMGIAPGTYYMRIISTLNNTCGDTLGTLVHLTIGRLRSEPLDILAEDSIVCVNATVEFEVDPYDFQSTYEWQLPPDRTFDVGSSRSFFVTANSPNDFAVRVRETNFGCVGEWAAWDTVKVLRPPQAILDVPSKVCIGDTLLISAVFFQETYYQWTIGNSANLIKGSEDLILGNNEAKVVFDTLGPQGIELYVLNVCNKDQTPKGVIVYDYPDTDAGKDTTVCRGEPVTLEGAPQGEDKNYWIHNNSVVSSEINYSTTVNSDGTYVLYIENEGGCITRDTVNLFAADPPAPTLDSVLVCQGDTARFGTDYGNDVHHEWNTGAQTDSISTVEDGEYYVTVTNTGEPCPIQKNYEVEYEICEAIFKVPNAFSPNGDGLNDRFTVVGDYFDIIELRIYNRWGELLYVTTDIKEGWDGSFRGKKQDPGVYTYVVRYEDQFGEQQIETGNVTLIR